MLVNFLKTTSKHGKASKYRIQNIDLRFVTTDKRLNVYVIISNVLQAITNVNVLNSGKADMESQCWKTQEPDQARTLSPQPPVELFDFP